MDDLKTLIWNMDIADNEEGLSKLQAFYVSMQQYDSAREVKEYRMWIRNMYVVLFNYGLSWQG